MTDTHFKHDPQNFAGQLAAKRHNAKPRTKNAVSLAVKPANHLRIVCVSDTHGYMHRKYNQIAIPEGDVLVHAGDIGWRGIAEEIASFDQFLGTLPHPHKVVIAGNHDWCLENAKTQAAGQKLFNHAIYLLDSEVIIEGIKFYGSPYQPRYFDWAFNVERGEAIAKHWRLIPNDVDVLITHGPPFGILDVTDRGEKVGCWDLKMELNRIKPKLHVFGHIHDSYGIERHDGTVFINASVCNKHYQPINPVLYYDLKLPSGG